MNKRNGIMALLGLGALAWWKYKKASPEEKQMVKDKINTAKENIAAAGQNLKDTVNEKLGNEQKTSTEQ